MPPCPDCGATPADSDRFCSNCGRAISAEFEILGAEPARTTEQTVGRSGLPKGPMLALVVLAVFLGAIGLIAGWSSGSEETAQQKEEQQEQDDDGGASTSTTDRPRTTRDRGATTVDRSTTSIKQLDDAPLLGRETGLSLLVGSGRLQRVDLDTGVVTEYEVRGMPLIESGGWLVLANPTSDELFAVPLDDPNGGPRIDLPGTGPWPGALPSERPGHAWLFDVTFEEERSALYHVDLSTGEIVDERDAPFAWFGTPAPAPDLAVAPDGGVFQWADDGYRPLGVDGLIAANDDVMLTTTCTGPTACDLSWIARDSDREVDRALPSSDRLFTAGRLSPGGRVLTLWSHAQPVIFDVERGTSISSSAEIWFEGVAVSPDERYLATTGERLTVTDLDADEVVMVNLSGGGLGVVLFVTNP
jgi:hypothetical protein